ncbi:MAG: ZPR1 zinc finger domain-containing protein [Candidatus Wukongarchaeota archaeon]|nr:ZPR1 zinc finger domain-containing protein [Candidatus Wukongarchaeota archaeon]MDO8130080.1 ZPR1 zinc finger domain-containing protein [Candidatus Wukongarchaeota archaeon]
MGKNLGADREVQEVKKEEKIDDYLREVLKRWNLNQIKNQKCPICQEKAMRVTESTYDLPYFKKIILFNMKCDRCNFKFNDIYIEDLKDPIRCALVIENSEHLNALVIRSVAGTIRVPELGAFIEPGPVAQPFITTVEGVFIRIKNMLETAIRWAETEKQKERGREVLRKLEMVLKAKMKVTLEIDDLFGNSTIIHEDVRMRPLTEEEVMKLAEKIPVFKIKYAGD